MATVLKSKTLSATPYVLALRRALAEGDGRKIAGFAIGELDIEIRAMRDAVWALIRRARCGGLALRMAHIADEFDVIRLTPAAGEALRLAVKSALGEHRIVLCGGGDALEHLRVTVTFTPASPMLVPFLPRDLYPLDADDDPLGATGVVEASQRGLNGGVLYFRIEEPEFGNVLYFQNLTAMIDYYRASRTKPDGVVGGR